MLGGLLGWREGEFPHNATTLLVSSTGRPWTQDGFRKSFFRLIQKLEAKGQVGPDLTFHGLRHFRATRLREAGFDKQTIADFRQETTSMAGYYSRDADLRGHSGAAGNLPRRRSVRVGGVAQVG